jgi:LytS/YehU family sensor histidine kinase
VQVRLAVEESDEMLVLRVTNTIAPGKTADREGIGLNNVRERLAVQFEGRAGLRAGPSGAEWISEIRMPWIHAAPDRRGAARISSREAA